ncbi:MAG: ATP-binding protein [Cyanobacteria bacterium J06642_9]
MARAPDIQLDFQLTETHKPRQQVRPTGLLIQPKIMLGYLLSVGIAVGGVMTGVYVSNAQRDYAQLLIEDVEEELELPTQIQEQLLIAEANQRLLPSLLNDPEALQDYVERFETAIVNARQAWDALKVSYEESAAEIVETDEELEALESLVKKYDPLLEHYHHRVSKLVTQIDLAQASTQAQEAFQADLLAVNSNALRKSIDGFEAELNHLLEVVSEETIEAETALARANQLREWITLGSLTAAVLLSIGLGFLISRTITQPLKNSAKVAQQVIDDANFDLQAPVTSQDEVGQLTQVLNLLIQHVKALLEEQEASKSLLVHNEKMSSLGQLVAGVAHEINNPVNFIHGNLSHIQTYTDDLLDLIQRYQQEYPQPSQMLQNTIEAVELAFLQEDLEKILASMKVGSDRIRDIVLSLRNFSRLDEASFKAVNLHDGIESTLMILQHRIKARPNSPEIKIDKQYGDTLPRVECYASQLNQVFMNLIANAIDALEDHSPENPTVTIRTGTVSPEQVFVQISDNGPGIPTAVQSQIFDPFFTTKPVGKGTGIGLSISHQIVVEKHSGQMTCKSGGGEGTTFTITLPIQH